MNQRFEKTRECIPQTVEKDGAIYDNTFQSRIPADDDFYFEPHSGKYGQGEIKSAKEYPTLDSKTIFKKREE